MVINYIKDPFYLVQPLWSFSALIVRKESGRTSSPTYPHLLPITYDPNPSEGWTGGKNPWYPASRSVTKVEDTESSVKMAAGEA